MFAKAFKTASTLSGKALPSFIVAFSRRPYYCSIKQRKALINICGYAS